MQVRHGPTLRHLTLWTVLGIRAPMRPIRPSDRRVWLASRSPRRRMLLEQLGFEPLVRAADILEVPLEGELAVDYTARLAAEKGQAVRIQLGPAAEPSWIVAADTVVVRGGVILEKPVDRADAVAMLKRLSGEEHEVWTGFWIGSVDGAVEHSEVTRSRVRFREVDEALIARYVDTGEPMDKAGAYGIQGIGGALVASIEGSYFNIVGLPVAQVAAVLRDLGALEGFPFAPKPHQEESP
ncbi:MAG: Maf family protein [Myxococcota bacterium]